VELSTSIGEVDGLFDVFDLSYPNFPVEPNFAVPFTEPQLEPLSTFSATPLIFPFIDDIAFSTDGITPQTNQQAQTNEDTLPVGTLSAIDAFLANGLQSGSCLDEESQSSNLTDIDYQSPLFDSIASSNATGEGLNTPSETSIAVVRCDFEGCGHVCKDNGSLRYVVSMK
jgi:hypothetical protein